MGALLLDLALGGLNIAKLVLAALKRFFSSLNAQGWIGVVVSIVLLFALLHEWGEARHFKKQSARYEQLYRNEQAAFAKTVANYRVAAEQARQADAANKARVEAEQTAINQERDRSYEARIAAARATAERLQRAAKGNSGSAGTAPVSSVPTTAGGSAQGASEGGLPADDRLLATEQAIQLDELIKWVRQQHAVDANKASK